MLLSNDLCDVWTLTIFLTASFVILIDGNRPLCNHVKVPKPFTPFKKFFSSPKNLLAIRWRRMKRSWIFVWVVRRMVKNKLIIFHRFTTHNSVWIRFFFFHILRSASHFQAREMCKINNDDSQSDICLMDWWLLDIIIKEFATHRLCVG